MCIVCSNYDHLRMVMTKRACAYQLAHVYVHIAHVFAHIAHVYAHIAHVHAILCMFMPICASSCSFSRGGAQERKIMRKLVKYGCAMGHEHE